MHQVFLTLSYTPVCNAVGAQMDSSELQKIAVLKALFEMPPGSARSRSPAMGFFWKRMGLLVTQQSRHS